MRKGRGRSRTAWGVSALLALATVAGPLAGQETRERDCRCVDDQGRAIERCVCVRMPDVERIVEGAWTRALDRPRLGLGLTLDDDGARGARISDVLEDGPAERAGLREGDVVTRLDGRSLLEPMELEHELGFDADRSLPAQRLLALARQLEPGDEVPLEYLRDGERRTATLRAEDLSTRLRRLGYAGPEWDARAFEERMRALSERMRNLHGPGMAPRAPRGPGSPGVPTPPDAPGRGDAFRFRFDEATPGARGWFRFRGASGAGVELVALNPELGSYFGVDSGVLVASVRDDSALGLRPGDVVLDIDGRAVGGDPARFHEILTTYDEDETIVFRVRREGREMSVSGRIG